MDVNVQIPATGRFKPNHVQGDKEFFGHGPVVDVWAEIYPLGTKIYLRYSARFQGGRRFFWIRRLIMLKFTM